MGAHARVGSCKAYMSYGLGLRAWGLGFRGFRVSRQVM